MLKELSMLIDGIEVTGTLEASPDNITVQILSPYQNLKAGAYLTGYGMGYHRFVSHGKLTDGAIQSGEEILKGLYLTGAYLQAHPEFIKRIRQYLARFDKQANAIVTEREKLIEMLNASDITRKDYDARVNELRLAELQNVTEKGVLFRQYTNELAQKSGGRADIESILTFASPSSCKPILK